MAYSLSDKEIISNRADLALIPEGKVLINTINQHSYNVAQTDELFANALRNGDFLIPDGISIVKVAKWLNIEVPPSQRVAGRDLFRFEMHRLNEKGGKVFFMGSSQKVLDLIKERCATIYPNIIVESYSPPYKPEFSEDDNKKIIDAINSSNPDLLWIGMTAPKQEKWVYSHWDELNINCHCGTIGAVFDFFATPQKNVPEWWQKHGLEWFYRLKTEPKRMYKRYVIGIPKFFYYVAKEKIKRSGKRHN